MDSGQAYTILALIGIGYLIYKVWDLSEEKKKLQKQLNDSTSDFKKGAEEIKDIVDKADVAVEALCYRLVDSAKTAVDIYKHTAKNLPLAERKKLARKIARDYVSSASKYKLPDIIQDTNDKKMTYYSWLFPSAEKELMDSGLDADLDKDEIVDVITKSIFNSK